MSLRHGIRSTAHGRIRLYPCGAHANGDSLDAGVGTCPVQPIASRQTKCSHPSIPAAAGLLYQFPRPLSSHICTTLTASDEGGQSRWHHQSILTKTRGPCQELYHRPVVQLQVTNYTKGAQVSSDPCCITVCKSLCETCPHQGSVAPSPRGLQCLAHMRMWK
jgi:hypothetical protein